MRLVGFVVRIKLLVARDHASVERMRLLARHLHHDGFVHAAGDDFSHDFLAPSLHLLGLACGFSHYRFSVALALVALALVALALVALALVALALVRSRSPRMV